jgi:hypothetical protein
MLSASEIGRQNIVLKRSVLQSLYGLVKAYSGKTRVLMGMAIFNLLADPTSRENVIRAGALSVLKIIATLEYENLREGTARVIVILAQSTELEKYVTREPIVPVLVLITKTSSKVAFECALNAFSCLSQSASYRKTLIEKGCISSLVGAVIDGKVTSVALTEEICRCFCLLSLSKDYSEDILETEHIMLALHILHKNHLISKEAGEMIAMLLRNLSCTSRVCRFIVEQDGLYLLSDLMRLYAQNSNVLMSSAMLLFHNLGKDSDLHERLIDEGMMVMIMKVTEIDQLYQQGREMEGGGGGEEGGGGLDDDLSMEPSDFPDQVGAGGEGEGEGDGECPSPLTASSNLLPSHHRHSSHGLPLHPSTTGPHVAPPLTFPAHFSSSQHSITEQQTINTASTISTSKQRKSKLSQDTIYDIVMAIQLVSLTPQCRELIVNGQVVKIFLSLLNGLNDVVRHEMVCALNNLASSRECREELVSQGAIDLLVNLAQSPYADTQAQCSAALGHLSENTQVKSGTVASLLLLALKAEDIKDNTQINPTNTRRASSVTGLDPNSIIQPSGVPPSGGGGGNVSAPARELLALQSVKSLRVMIRDGLLRRREKHGIHIGDDDGNGSVSLSAGSFRGTSLEDLNEIGYLHFTTDEKAVIQRNYSSYEYQITYHPVSHEPGGMSTHMKVDLPYPTVSMRDVEKDDRTGDLIEVKISEESLLKNTAETKIHELTRYASTASEVNDDDDLHRSWSHVGGTTKANTHQNQHQQTPMSSAVGGGGSGTSTKKKKKPKRGGSESGASLDHARSLPEASKVWKEVIPLVHQHPTTLRKESPHSPSHRREGTN